MSGFAAFLGSVRGGPEDRPDPLTRARLAPDPVEEPADDDERAANLMARQYAPGQLSQLSQQLGDTLAELAAEWKKIEDGERETTRVRRMLAAGQIGAMEARRRLDGDFGDEDTAQRLERRAVSLRRRLEDASALIAPAPQRVPDPLEAATQRAHQVFVEATRARLAGTPARARRPFGGGSGGVAVRSEEVTCAECIEVGATPEESFAIHHPELLPELDLVPVPDLDSERSAAREREVTRLVELGFSPATAALATVPAG